MSVVLAVRSEHVRDIALAQLPRFRARFHKHVMPSLTQLCKTYGFFLALGLVEFEKAYQRVMQAAISRGALHLPPAIFDDLEEWICICLTDVATSHDHEICVYRQTADRVCKECDVYFAALTPLATS